jgi:hypothetical protein
MDPYWRLYLEKFLKGEGEPKKGEPILEKYFKRLREANPYW